VMSVLPNLRVVSRGASASCVPLRDASSAKPATVYRHLCREPALYIFRSAFMIQRRWVNPSLGTRYASAGSSVYGKK
jgi:hypothetical protein